MAYPSLHSSLQIKVVSSGLRNVHEVLLGWQIKRNDIGGMQGSKVLHNFSFSLSFF